MYIYSISVHKYALPMIMILNVVESIRILSPSNDNYIADNRVLPTKIYNNHY